MESEKPCRHYMHMQVSRVHELLAQILRAPGIIAAAMTPPKKDQALVGAWRELAERHARVVSALERSLAEHHDLGVTEFEVLERLASTEGDQCRMAELTDATHLSQSALSRLVGRLESEGLVTRAICSDDRR